MIFPQSLLKGEVGRTRERRARTTAVAPNPAAVFDIQFPKKETILYPNSSAATIIRASEILSLMKKFTQRFQKSFLAPLAFKGRSNSLLSFNESVMIPSDELGAFPTRIPSRQPSLYRHKDWFSAVYLFLSHAVRAPL